MGKSATKTQTNVRMSAERTAALDVAAAVEGKDKGQIMEEALRLREELLGADYQQLIAAALAVRFAKDPQERLEGMKKPRHGKTAGAMAASLSVARSQVEADANVSAVTEYAARHANNIAKGTERARAVLAGGDAAIAAHLLEVDPKTVERVAGRRSTKR